jgi:hypothetical protein
VWDDNEKPYWIDHHPEMRKGVIDSLPSDEVQFWKGLIDKYLFVLKKNVQVSEIISAVHFPTLNIGILYRFKNL